MGEIQKLRAQLVQSVRQCGWTTTDATNTVTKLQPLTSEGLPALRNAILSGFIDQVAVRKESVAKGNSPVAYQLLVASVQSKSLLEDIYIHPTSCVFKKSPPMVVFQELVQTSKVYMKGVTEITDPLALGAFGQNMCTFSKPVENPPPKYLPLEDRIVCYAYPRFGDRSWELPLMQVDYPEGTERVRVFARFLLEGKLFDTLKPFVESMISKPSLLTNPKIPLTQAKILALVQPLMDQKVQGREDLKRVWKENPKFLLRGYLQWLPSTFHQDVTAHWPPLSSS